MGLTDFAAVIMLQQKVDLEEIDCRSPVHLELNHLELGDLTLGPTFGQGAPETTGSALLGSVLQSALSTSEYCWDPSQVHSDHKAPSRLAAAP